MTSTELAALHREAENRWYDSKLKARISRKQWSWIRKQRSAVSFFDIPEALNPAKWKDKYVARAIAYVSRKARLVEAT